MAAERYLHRPLFQINEDKTMTHTFPFRPITFSVLLILCHSLAWSTPGKGVTHNAPVDTLVALLKDIRSMKANYSQVTINKSGKSIEETHGQMALQRPRLFRWSVAPPTRQLIIADGKNLWIFDPDLQQVSVKPINNMLDQSPMLILSGETSQFKKDYAVSAQKDKGNTGTKQFVLTPKNKHSGITRVVLHFKSSRLTSMTLLDTLDHKTVIHFSKISLNPTLKSTVFTFIPPKGTDIIGQPIT